MRMSERDRRDWSLLVFIVPLGILLMLIAGQFAMRIIPQWILNVGMGSRLEVETAGGQQNFIQPLFNIQILTPFSWQNTYLTPNADSGFVFPPFVVLEPSATPSPTEAPSSTETATPPATTTTPSATVVVTATTPPPATSTEGTSPPPTTCTDLAATNNGGPLPCVYPPTTCTDPAATNNGGPLPCVYPPTTCTDPAATNNGGPLPCVYPPTTCTDPAATNNGGPLPCVYPPPPITSTVDPLYTPAPVPPELGVGTPPDNTDPYDDSNIGAISDGTYIVINLGVVVETTPDSNYDLAFYEYNNGDAVYLDWIIIGITNDSDATDGIQYYEVFNWGNNGTPAPDTNSNVGDVAQTTGTEDDNQPIDLTELHDPDGAGSAPQTGFLIDVDNATSNPPADTYNYVVIISPNGGGSGQAAQVDSVQATEVPIPTP